MSEEHFHTILDECVTRMLKGESLDSCLAAFPEEADRLKPLLRVVNHSRNLPRPEARLESKRLGRERVLAAARRLQERNKSIATKTNAQFARYIKRAARWIKNLFVGKEIAEMKLAYRIAIYTLITVVIGGFFTVNTSAQSLPGDPLYGVKKGWEQVRLSLALSEESQQELEDRFEKNRMEEVSALLEKNKSAKVEFEASIEGMEGELWNIGGFNVHVNQDTELEGVLQVGSLVEVEGLTQEDGSILALEIELLTDDGEQDDDDDLEGTETPAPQDGYAEMEASGTLESMSGGSAVVDGISYMITGETEMEDEVEVGDYVTVEYYENEDGDLILLELEREDDDRDDDDDDEDDDIEEMEASGTLESMSGGSAVVDGISYMITGETEMEDEVEVGDYVTVEYYENEDGDLILLELEREDDDRDDDDEDDDIEEMEASGTLESMSGGSAVVDGISYMITGETEMEDEVSVGDYVTVEYYENEDGDLILLELEREEGDQDDDEDDDIEEMEAYGTVESITDNSMVIDGVTYLVTEGTDLDDDLAVGDQVKIKFFENEEGDLLLLDIDVESEIVDTPEPEDDDDEDGSDGDDDDGEEDEEDDEGDEDEEE